MGGILGNGFTAKDREMLTRLDQGFIDHIILDDKRHDKQEVLCGNIDTAVGKLKVCVAKNKSFISLARTAVIAIIAMTVALGSVIYEAVSSR